MNRHGDRFLRRILGPEEQAALVGRHDRAQFVAGRFAAKEAAIKAMADILAVRPPYPHIQIVNDPGGRPVYRFHSSLQPNLDSFACHLSISHEKSMAAAVAVFTEDV
jgi:holo-[acyl-carrier protein] synthase